MNIDQILLKSQPAYCLLSSFNEPNILIQCQCVIDDVKIKNDEIIYKVKLLKIYDCLDFLRNHFYNMLFYTEFDQPHKFKLTLDANVSSMSEFNNMLREKQQCILVSGLMTFPTKVEMQNIFDKLNMYFICLNIFALKESLLRNPYYGFLRLKSPTEFFDRLKNFLGDKFPEEVSLDNFIKDLKYSKPLYSKFTKIKKIVHRTAKKRKYIPVKLRKFKSE